jgi:hypothetical protein
MALLAVVPDLFIIKHQRVPLTLRIHKHTTLISFKRYNDAEFISETLESQYFAQKEWPDLTAENFKIFSAPVKTSPITLLDIMPETFDNLKSTCINWNLNLCTIDTIVNRKSSLEFKGEILSFTVPLDYYKKLYDIIYFT